MKNEFDTLVKEHFGRVLTPYGFSSEGSKRSSFYRKIGDIYHFIIADPLVNMSAYDIKVFATSPLIDPEFTIRFPDDLGIPSDTFCYLKSGEGVGHRASRFPCQTKSAFERSFEGVVKKSLQFDAIPYLDNIVSINDLSALVRHPYFKQSFSSN